MRVSILDTIPHSSQLVDAWNDLAMRMEHPEVFYTYQWSAAACRAFGATLSPLICLVYEGDRLCGVAALATARNVHESAFFLTASTADYCDIVSGPDQRRSVIEALFVELRRRSIKNVILANVPAESRTLRVISHVSASHHFSVHNRAAYECGLVELGSQGERHALLQDLRRKDREKRGLKKMSALGSVRLVHEENVPPASELASIICAQVSRFLATGRVSPLVQSERRQFLKELAQSLGEAGWLKISRLEVGGQAVAWNFGFRYSESWFWYLPTFQIQFENSSPGSCLLRLMLEEACEDASLKRLDLGLGDESYKQRFANAERPTRYIQLSTSVWRNRKIALRQFLTDSISRSRLLEVATRKLRDQARNLHRRVKTDGLMATVAYGLARSKRLLVSTDEVLVFEAPLTTTVNGAGTAITQMDWRQLSDAATAYSDDLETLQYLTRCAARLRVGVDSGYALKLGEEPAVHFLWAGNYDGFHVSEIDYKLEGAASGSMIFDCWTPVVHRGHGYYADAIHQLALYIQSRGKQAWIFSASANKSSLRGIAKAGFVYRFSLTRNSALGFSKVTRYL